MIDYKEKKLSNGLRIISAPVKTSEAVTVFILTGVGGRFESKENSGISHFLEHLFFKGTKKRPSAHALAKELDGLGANYNAFTSEECTGFYIQSSANDFAASLELISDLFLNPLFPEEEFEREKGVILEEANMRRDVPQVHVQVLSQEQMFPGSPLGHDLVGTPESVKKITREDVAQYFKAGYNPSSTILVIAGNPKNFNWEQAAEQIFTKMENNQKPEYLPFSDSKIDQKIAQEVRKVDQTHLIFSARTFCKTDERRFALAILSTVLGGGMSSRLFSEIREKRGWAYYVSSDYQGFFDTGLFSISAGVKSDKVKESVEIIVSEIENLKSEGPKAEELERAKNNLRGHLALALEDSFEIAGFLAEGIYYDDKALQPEQIIEKLNAVSAEDVKKVAQDVFQSGKIGLALIGPKDYKKDLENLF